MLCRYLTDGQGAPCSKQGPPTKGGHQSRSPAPQLGQRERSTSAPNVCANMVDITDLNQQVRTVAELGTSLNGYQEKRSWESEDCQCDIGNITHSVPIDL